MPKQLILPALLPAALLALMPAMAQAYVGPGMGLGLIASLLGLVAAFAMVLVAVVWFPLKRALRKRRAGAETGGTAAE